MLRKFLYSLGPVSIITTSYLIVHNVTIGNLSYGLSYVIYIALLFGYNGLLVYLFRYLLPGEIKSKFIDEVCGYKYVSLNMFIIYCIAGIVCFNLVGYLTAIYTTLFISIFKNYYIVNPMFYLFGYKYYYEITINTGKKILVISNKKYLSKEDMNIDYCVFFDDNTAIDINENN